MGLENPNFINDLVVTNPTSSDKRRFGDDHLRAIKKAIKNTFPNIQAAVTITAAELNRLSGVSSGVQSQIDGKLAVGSVGLSGGDGIDVTGSLDALVAAVNTTVVRTTGAQTIGGVKSFSSRPKMSSKGGFLSHDNAANVSGRIVITNTEPTDLTGLSPGDIVLVY